VRQIVVALTILVALLGVVGCGGSDTETLRPALSDLRQELGTWTFETERLTNAVDHGQVSALHFRPAPEVLTDGELHRVSPNGLRITSEAFFSEEEMKQASDLANQEIKNLYCYLFSWYQKEGSLPQPDQLERFFYEDLRGRLIPSAPPEKLRGAATLLSEAITNAQNSGEAGANVAIAAMCSLPKFE
jgi:hypothetical protein